MFSRHLLDAALMLKEKQLRLHANLDVSAVKNVRRPVQTVQLLLRTSVHTLITKNVLTVVHVKRHARDTLFFKKFIKENSFFQYYPLSRQRDFFAGIFIR